MRGVPLRVISAHLAEAHDPGNDLDSENRLAQTQLNRRLARWTRLYPDVRVEPTVIHETVARYLERHADSGQVFVTDAHAARDVCGAHSAGCSMLTVRCGNL